jgi:hypothetical protein
VNVEDDLRTVLQERAAEAAPQRDLLELVGTGVRRDRRRRTALAGGAAALALAAVIAVPVALSGRTHQQQPTPPPAATWTAPTWQQPAFPMTPSWLPAGTGQPEVIQRGPNVALKYEKDEVVLSAEIGPVPAAWEVEGEQDRPGTVHGQPATIRTGSTYDGAKEGERYVGIRWRLADGRWVQVLSFGRRTEAQVQRFADGLRPGDIAAGRPPFSIAVVPPGLTLQFQGVDTMCLAPKADDPAKQDEVRRQPGGLCLMVLEEPFDDAGLTGVVESGGRRMGWWADSQLHVDLGGGRVLEVGWDPDVLSLTTEDAIRFAAGVDVNP